MSTMPYQKGFETLLARNLLVVNVAHLIFVSCKSMHRELQGVIARPGIVISGGRICVGQAVAKLSNTGRAHVFGTSGSRRGPA